MFIMSQLHFSHFLSALLVNLLLISQVSAFNASKTLPEIQHASGYKFIEDINAYWISEKLDGIRGYWDGEQLLTRKGNIIHHPTWFTQHWPATVMDGELWIARAQFQATLSCVNKLTIDEACWRNVRFMIFDLPKHNGTFSERVNTMTKLTHQNISPYLDMITQFKLTNLSQLNEKLDQVTVNNGEGLMIHKGNAYYHIGRTSHLMKLKKNQDAEATVIAHTKGKGKYKGMLGAITVKTATGIVFNIGSGFSDKERVNPPTLGSVITYRYNGKTQAGIPRFARFYRIRNKN